MYFLSEVPKVYFSKSDIELLPSLIRPVRWTFWAFGSYIQFFLYTLISRLYDKSAAKKLYSLETLILEDGEKIVVAWGKQDSPTAILVLLHTICGDYSESAHFAKKMSDLNWLPVSYSRRGHSNLLLRPEFNTVGSQKDLVAVLETIRLRFPELPIFALGSSAGSSLLARYLGDNGDRSMISGAVLVSPGYDFEKSQSVMPRFASSLAVRRAKKFFLERNREILEKWDKEAFDAMMNAKSMYEWHEHQWKFAGNYISKRDYYNEHNPVHVLTNITCPVMYINAMDDIAFPRALTREYKSLTENCDCIVVHTERGSHLGFFEGWNLESWALKVAKEFFLALNEKKRGGL